MRRVTTRDRSHRHAAFRGTKPVQLRHSLAPPVPSAVSARKSQNAENTLRHNVSNTWQLTKRSGVRILFGEPNISHFEILSDLLVNDAAPFIGKNVPFCRGVASLRLWPHRLLTCSDWARHRLFKVKISLSPSTAARLVNTQTPSTAGGLRRSLDRAPPGRWSTDR